MPSLANALILSLLSASTASAQSVFAHVILGVAASYDQAQWTSDIQLASSYGIDGFVLNFVSPASGAEAQLQNAFNALDGLQDTEFKLLFSLDYNSNPTWTDDDIISLIGEYGSNPHYFMVDGKPMVSTFEGPNVNDWPAINSSINGGIYFVPDWTSLGPGAFPTDIVDGGFSWDIWPNGPNNISTSSDDAWTSTLNSAGKSYMMGVSPWFYTDLPQYNKAWVWRGDDMWYRRWNEVLDVLPPFVEIVTWNDYGESHYVGPIYEAGIPPGADVYVDNRPHTAWLETLPYQIAAYKNAYDSSNPASEVAAGDDKIVAWYRTSPASAGTTEATGNYCKSAINIYGYQTCYPVDQIEQDGIFAIILASASGSASISIGDGDATSFDDIQAGINFISAPFGGLAGAVTVTFGDIILNGEDITAEPADGVANFNAWTGCAGACAGSADT